MVKISIIRIKLQDGQESYPSKRLETDTDTTQRS